jgi:predicted nuclease with TOPRIM domain
MSKRNVKKTDDVDWNALLATGSFIGNILQAADRSQLQKNLDLTKAQAEQLFSQKEGLRIQLEALKKAYEQLKEKVRVLEDVNHQLNDELTRKNKKIEQLEEKLKK